MTERLSEDRAHATLGSLAMSVSGIQKQQPQISSVPLLRFDRIYYILVELLWYIAEQANCVF